VGHRLVDDDVRECGELWHEIGEPLESYNDHEILGVLGRLGEVIGVTTSSEVRVIIAVELAEDDDEGEGDGGDLGHCQIGSSCRFKVD